LKPRNITGDGVVAGGAPRRSHLNRDRDLADVWADVTRRVDERLDQNLALHIDERNDFVVGRADNPVRTRQNLAIQDARLSGRAYDTIRTGKEQRVEPVDKNSSVRNILNSGEADPRGFGELFAASRI